MDTHENKNFYKLTFILLDIVTKQLRYIFRQNWDIQHPSYPWRNDQKSLLCLKTEAKQHCTWNELSAPKAGDPNKWDPTNLFYVLLNSNTISLSPADNQHIRKLRDIRNKYFAHHCTASINDTDFEDIYQDVKKCMIDLKCSSSVLKEMEDLKVREDYLKEEAEKLDIIKTVETDNNNRLTLITTIVLVLLLQVAVIAIFSTIFIYLLGIIALNPHQYYNSIDVLPKSQSDQLKDNFILADSFYKTQNYESCIQILRRVLNSSYEVDYHKEKHILHDFASLAFNVTDTYFNERNFAMGIEFCIFSFDTQKMLETDSCSVASFYFDVVSSLFDRLIFYSHADALAFNHTWALHAAVAFNQIWTIYKQNECEENLDHVAYFLGAAYYHSGQYNDSIDVLCESANLLKSRSDQIKANFILADSYFNTQNYESCIQILRRVLNSSYEVDYHKEKHILHDFASLAFNVTAAVAFNQTWTIYKQNECVEENLKLIAFYLAEAYYHSGQYNDSIDILCESANLLKSHSDQLKANFILADSYYKTQNYESCIQILRRVLNSSYEVDYHKENHILHDFASLAFNVTAAVAFNQTWTIYKQNECVEENLKLVAFYLAEAYHHSGQYNDSIDILCESANLLKSHSDQLKANFILADSYYKTQNYESCIQILRRVLNSLYEVDYHKEKHILHDFASLAFNVTDTYFNQRNFAMGFKFCSFFFDTLIMLETNSCSVASFYFSVSSSLFDLLTYIHINAVVYSPNWAFHAALAFNQTWTIYKQNECVEENLKLVAFYLADAYYNSGQYNDSIDILLKSADLRKSHVDQLKANYLIAAGYYMTQNNERCFKFVERAYNSSYEEVDYHEQRFLFYELRHLAILCSSNTNVAMAIPF